MEVLSILETSKAAFAIVAFLLGLFAGVPYHVAILQGHRPPYTTYVGWLLLGATGFWFHYQTILPDDPKWSVFLPAAFVFVPLSYLLLLVFLRAGWKLEKRDKVCLGGIFMSWVIWVVTQATIENSGWMILVPLLALVITDAFALWPILQDASRGKESGGMEKISWGMTFASTIFGGLAVEKPLSLEMIYPTYLIITMGLIAACSFFSVLWLKKERGATTSPAE